MRISDWSSDVCSSDLLRGAEKVAAAAIDDAVRRAIGRDTLIDRGILERRVELAIGAVDADLPVIAEALFGANDIFIDRLVFEVGGDDAVERRDRAVVAKHAVVAPAFGAVRVRDRPAEPRRLVGIERAQLIEPVVIHFGPAAPDFAVGGDRQLIAADRTVSRSAVLHERTARVAGTRWPHYA